MMILAAKRQVISLLVLATFFSKILLGQNNLPVNSANNLISYETTLKFDNNYSPKILYTKTIDWFNTQNELFFRTNKTDTLKDNPPNTKRVENKKNVLKEFANSNPLQHKDPESNRLSGKGILRYTGAGNSCIRLFYVQYSIVIVAQNNSLSVELSNFRYNHFNPRSYLLQPVFNWSGQMPCDEVNTLEYLRDCENCHDEFLKFYSFIKEDTEQLTASLKKFIENENPITQRERE